MASRVRALLKRDRVMGAGRPQKDQAGTVPEYFLQAEHLLVKGLCPVDIGDQQVDMREALRFNHGAYGPFTSIVLLNAASVQRRCLTR